MRNVPDTSAPQVQNLEIESRLLRQCERELKARALLAPGDHVIVGCSGGVDSTVLLDLLVRLVPSWKFRLTVAHVNYGLRGTDSDEDEAFVRAMAATHGIEARVLHVPPLKSASLQASARKIRLQFFDRLKTELPATAIALAHTRSDQAETVLLRVMRGTSVSGLGSMAFRTPGGLVRPLLDWSRADVLAYAQARGLAWREDRTNATSAYTRNRIRHQLIPTMREFNPQVERALAQLAESAQREHQLLEQLCAQLEPTAPLTWLSEAERMSVTMPVEWLVSQAEALQYRLLNRWLLRLQSMEASAQAGEQPSLHVPEDLDACDELPSDSRSALQDRQREQKHLSAILKLLERAHTRPTSGLQTLHLPDGFVVRRDLDRLVLEKRRVFVARAAKSVEANTNSDVSHWLDVPGVYTLFDGRTLSAEWADFGADSTPAKLASTRAPSSDDLVWWSLPSELECLLDASQVQLPLQIRYPQPGDRFFPLGAPAFTSLKEFFIRQKVPRDARATQALVLTGETVLWIVGLRRAEQAKLTHATDKVIRLRVTSHSSEANGTRER